MSRIFLGPVIVSCVALGATFVWGGLTGFLFAILLSILEVTLSFDNAVVNAKVLTRMSEKWQRRFLTWGILVAVFGTRLVLPVLIVAASVWMGPLAVARLAVSAPEEYAHLLEGARYVISAFGGAFLLMVSLQYFFDEAKDVHWIRIIEKRLSRWGRIEAIEIAMALAVLAGLSFFVPSEVQAQTLVAGLVGVVLFIAMQGLAGSMNIEAKGVAASGLTLFLYLNVLDSAFSLDGVIGAFAITSDILIIFVGLGIGAYFVRAMTIYLVRKKTLETLKYLEHGAHWAILGLALSMLAGLIVHIPEAITGLIGLAFVVAAYLSSIMERRRAGVR